MEHGHKKCCGFTEIICKFVEYLSIIFVLDSVMIIWNFLIRLFSSITADVSEDGKKRFQVSFDDQWVVYKLTVTAISD